MSIDTNKKEKFKIPADNKHIGIFPFEKEMIEKCGWYAHYVFGEDKEKMPFGVNIHTHGILENFNHPDLQLCMSLNQKTAQGILWSAFEYIKEGGKFEPGKEYDQVLTGYKVMAINARENGRDVIRIVLPASDGTYTGIYAEQLTKTGRENIN